MSAPRIFIDGHVGTTGLRIRDLLATRRDVTLVDIPDAERKNPSARADRLNDADIVILCLPDDAAREAVAMIRAPNVRVIDASSAHRVAEGWDYGLPELDATQRARLAASHRVSVPGCYPTTVILGLRPLLEAHALRADTPVTVHALSGYTGGGRTMIERWEDPGSGLVGVPFEAPYALDRIHKHLPEMVAYTHLTQPPQFVPAVGPFATGMRVEIPLHVSVLAHGTTGHAVWKILEKRYAGEPFVQVAPYRESLPADEFLYDPRRCNGTNRIELHVVPNPAGHVLLIGLLDNLGKGAAGAALQNLNLLLGVAENTGLTA
jgi:N-acetyl-gamma-glutamyl-phosphate reductase